MRNLFLVFSFLLVFSNLQAAPAMQVRFDLPATPEEADIQQQLQTSDAVDAIVDFTNQTFATEQSVQLIFGTRDGPLFDPEDLSIQIPYAFITEVQQRFTDANYAETGLSAATATMDALMHTLFHELAHALIYLYELPVVGKEEDAADSLATILLIEFFEDGQEIAISAADLFALESDDVETFEESDFWDEHSLDAQRYYATLCHVYGSDPDSYRDIITDADFSEDRAELCIEEYQTQANSWQVLLKPFMLH